MSTRALEAPAAPQGRPPGRAPRRRWSALRLQSLEQWILLVPAVVIVAYLALTPLVFLLWQALFSGGFTLERLTVSGAAGSLPRLAWSSLVFTGGATLVAVVVGTTLAYIYERTDVPFRGLIFVSALIPLVMPNILYSIAWILLASPSSGLINDAAEQMFHVTPLNIFSMPGMIWVEGTNMSTVVFLIVAASLRSTDPSLEEASAVAGARGSTILRRITLPLVAPAIAAASLLVSMRVLGSFETPALLGLPAGVFVFTSNIWLELSRFPADIPGASGQSVWLILLSAVLVFYYFSRFGGARGRQYQTITGKAFRVRRRALTPKAKVVASTVVLTWVFLALLLPIVTLVYVSLLPAIQLPSLAVLDGVSLNNYQDILGNSVVRRSFINSFLVAVVTATVVMTLMALVAWFLARTSVRRRWLIDVVSFAPLAVPSIVLGLAILIVYLRIPLPVYGTLAILAIAYVTKFLPHGIRYAWPAIVQVGEELEEAAQTSGASWWRMFRKVTLPLMMPGLIAGWIFIASISVQELATSLLLYSQGTEVLSISLWQLWEAGDTTEVAALGVLMVLALVVMVSVAKLVGGRASITNAE